MVDEQEQGWGLMLSFTGLLETMPEEAAFTHGFEVGGIWQRMRSGLETEVEETVNEANKTIFERAAAGQGWSIEWVPISDGYATLKLKKVAASKANPHGLRIVKNSQ